MLFLYNRRGRRPEKLLYNRRGRRPRRPEKLLYNRRGRRLKELLKMLAFLRKGRPEKPICIIVGDGALMPRNGVAIRYKKRFSRLFSLFFRILLSIKSQLRQGKTQVLQPK